MKKNIIGFIVVVAAVIPLHVSLVSAADNFFGSGSAFNNPHLGTSNDAFFGNPGGSVDSGIRNPADESFFGSIHNPDYISNQDNLPFGYSDTQWYGDTFFGPGSSYNADPIGVCDDNCFDSYPCEYGCDDYGYDYGYEADPCDYTWCYPQHDNSEYQGADIQNDNSNSNSSVNNNNNTNINEIYINVYGNGSVTGTGIDTSNLPSCNDARDNDEDGRIDFDDSDCMIYGRENGKSARLNSSAPTFVSVAPTSAREGVTYVYDADARDADADMLVYSLIQNPNGMTIESSNGVISWTPTSAQSGIAHGVTVAVSDGSRQTMQSFQVFVDKVTQLIRSTGVSQNEGRVAGVSSVAVAEASDKSVLRSYNIRIDTDELGNSVVSWDTTKPTRGRVIFGRASQGDRTGTDFTGAGQYEFATPNTPETSTSHRVILGQLEGERVYYFRVVSFAGTDTTVSSERSFVQLPSGETLRSEAGFASVIGTLGSFLFSPWFLLLMIIVIVLVIVFRRRNEGEIIAHAPVEMHTSGGHH